MESTTRLSESIRWHISRPRPFSLILEVTIQKSGGPNVWGIPPRTSGITGRTYQDSRYLGEDISGLPALKRGSCC